MPPRRLAHIVLAGRPKRPLCLIGKNDNINIAFFQSVCRPRAEKAWSDRALRQAGGGRPRICWRDVPKVVLDRSCRGDKPPRRGRQRWTKGGNGGTAGVQPKACRRRDRPKHPFRVYCSTIALDEESGRRSCETLIRAADASRASRVRRAAVRRRHKELDNDYSIRSRRWPCRPRARVSRKPAPLTAEEGRRAMSSSPTPQADHFVKSVDRRSSLLLRAA